MAEAADKKAVTNAAAAKETLASLEVVKILNFARSAAEDHAKASEGYSSELSLAEKRSEIVAEVKAMEEGTSRAKLTVAVSPSRGKHDPEPETPLSAKERLNNELLIKLEEKRLAHVLEAGEKEKKN